MTTARRRPLWPVLTSILCAALLACSGTGSPAPGASVGPTGAATTLPPATAKPANPSPSTAVPAVPMQDEQIAVAADERVVELFVPPTPTGAKAPLLILLHASGENSLAMAAQSHAGELAARESVIVALPPALGRTWDGRVSAVDPIKPSADAAYIVGLIARLEAELPIDPDRVFVAGFSMGAVMSERIACQFADRVTAVALNAGAPWSDECAPSRPVPILVMHGTADQTFPITLASQVVDRWRAADRCVGEPVITHLSDIATSELSDQCAAGVQVEFVRYAGVGHRWFSNPFATDLLWSFFASVSPR